MPKLSLPQAQNEAALASASQVDIDRIPPELDWLGHYTAAPLSEEKGFKEDPTAWQNKSFQDFVTEESSRSDMWPFAVCGLYVLSL